MSNKVIGIFASESFIGMYPKRNLWKMMRTLGMDVSAYKDLVKAMYSSTWPEDDILGHQIRVVLEGSEALCWPCS